MSLSEAVREGRLPGLRALRDALASEIEAGPPEYSGRGPVPASQTASLARQLQDVLRQIEAIESAQPKGSVVDELEGKRASRLATSAGGGSARRRGGKRGAGGA